MKCSRSDERHSQLFSITVDDWLFVYSVCVSRELKCDKERRPLPCSTPTLRRWRRNSQQRQRLLILCYQLWKSVSKFNLQFIATSCTVIFVNLLLQYLVSSFFFCMLSINWVQKKKNRNYTQTQLKSFGFKNSLN